MIPQELSDFFILLTLSSSLQVIVLGFIGGILSGFIGSGGAFFMTPGMMNLGVPGVLAVGSNITHKFGKAARRLFLDARVPDEISAAISHHADKLEAFAQGRWAVRSSAIQEDERFTFAGQFESWLDIKTEELATTYKAVLASRFTERAMRYRLHHGVREADTRMAVLMMPLIQPRFAGVLYTRTAVDTHDATMQVNAVPGLAHAMVRGEARADSFLLSRSAKPEVLSRQPALDSTTGSPLYAAQPSDDDLKALGILAQRILDSTGYDMDIEWAIDKEGAIRLLQGRRLHLGDDQVREDISDRDAVPWLEQGLTVFPGRAEGPVVFIAEDGPPHIEKKGSIAVASHATPDLASILPYIGGLLVEGGNPVGHLAALVREFSVPCLFDVGKAVFRLNPGSIVSMDATRRRVYRGSCWPGLRERVLARIESRTAKRHSGPLQDAVLTLNLIDPHASGFKPSACRSLHDVIRYIHEMSVRAMFAFGDRQKRPWRHGAIPLVTPIPIKVRLIDLDGCAPLENGRLAPEQVNSRPFQALWSGLASAEVNWDRRPNPTLDALPRDFVEQITNAARGPRGPRDTNYFIVARDYVNFNARFAYHYAMTDAVAGPWLEKNYVMFRFQGGGASDANRERRARFLESVLRLSGFGVDRRGDLLAAWLHSYPQEETERALATIGRLMGCARELDTLLTSDDAVKRYVGHFMEGRFDAFR